jgi:hypothetical protein
VSVYVCVCVCTWLRSHTCPGEIIKTENKTNLKNYRFISQCDRRVDWWLVRPLLAAMTCRVLAAMTLVLAAVTCRILAAMMSSAHDLLSCRKAFSPSSCMNDIYVRGSYRRRSMVFGILSSYHHHLLHYHYWLLLSSTSFYRYTVRVYNNNYYTHILYI